MSSTSSGASTADRQRLRAARGTGAKKTTASRLPSPPRQRRPALAAIALLLIVGGALVAGLLAIRMDSRVPVLAADGHIAPGTRLTEENTKTVQVAYEDLNLIPEDIADEYGIGKFARGVIEDNMLIDGHMVSKGNPFDEGRAVVSVVLTRALAPSDLEPGDLVEIVRATGSSQVGESATRLTRGLVLSIQEPDNDELGGGAARSADLLVPAADAAEVIDASGANLAGIARVSRGNTTEDVTLSGF